MGAGSLNMNSASARREFMRSTWQSKPQSEWNWGQRYISRLNVLPNPPGAKPAPIKERDDPVPVWSAWQQHKYIFPWLVTPMLLQYAWMRGTGSAFSPVAAYVMYTLFYRGLVQSSTVFLNGLGMKYGFLDSKTPRDGVPDGQEFKIIKEAFTVIFLRPLLPIFWLYSRDELPNVTWLLPIKLFLWSIITDYYFYVYHRMMHEVPFLWKFHQKHHLTKHPSSLLSAFADFEQEVCDNLAIPLLTLWTMSQMGALQPNFFECFAAMQYIIAAESGGHSGARVWLSSPLNSMVLRPLGMELALEDHDLHHRYGWRNSFSYGKQSRVWDVLFGTTRERIETKDENVDWSWTVSLP